MEILRKCIFSFIFLFVFGAAQAVFLFSPINPALADTSLFENQTGMTEVGTTYGASKVDIRVIIARIIIISLEFLSVIFLGLTIFAGFRYMTAAGNEDQTKKALAQIKNAVIGLVIVLASWALTVYILYAINWTTRGIYY